MSQIIPAILTADPITLKSMVRQAETFTDWIQLDIMDGIFVPSKSVIVADIEAVSPLLGWEAHLMVSSPENYIANFKKAGAQKIVFHYEATQHPQKVIAKARENDLMVGLAVNPDTPLSAILSLVGNLDSVLFLSVYPGYYGNEFIPKVLEKISEFRTALPDMETGIDGGVKENNIVEISQSGVDCIYVGSAIFLQNNPADSYYRLQKLIK